MLPCLLAFPMPARTVPLVDTIGVLGEYLLLSNMFDPNSELCGGKNYICRIMVVLEFFLNILDNIQTKFYRNRARF